jgi:hypothetical protein
VTYQHISAAYIQIQIIQTQINQFPHSDSSIEQEKQNGAIATR